MSWHRWSRHSWPFLLGVPVLAIGWVASREGSEHATSGNDASGIVAPESVAFGELRPGQGGSVRFRLRNSGPDAVRVARIESECPCLRTQPAALELAAGQEAEVVVTYDPGESPDFRGKLATRLVGTGPGGAPLFRVAATLTVADGPPASKP